MRSVGTKEAAVALCTLAALCPCASALNPSLDISQYAHRAWTVREAFFKGVIFTIAQTPDGYLWLGTEFGLERFDGVRSVTWEPRTGEHLPGGRVKKLLVARDGRLWIGTEEGLASWKDGKLISYPTFAGKGVTSLLEDHEGTIWGGFGPNGRLCSIRGRSVQCQGENGEFGGNVTFLFEDSGANLWASASTGLWRWNPGSPKFYRMKTTPLGLIESQPGKILVSTNTGITELAGETIATYPVPAGVRQVRPGIMIRDRDGGLWIATIGQGVVHLHDGKADRFAHTDGLSGDFVLDLFEDREGSIWVATTDGLDRFREFAIPTMSVKEGLPNAPMSVLAATDGSLWVATLDRLVRRVDTQATVYRKPNGLPDNSIGSLYEDSNGRIWASTLGGVAYLDGDRFVPVSGVPPGIVASFEGDAAGSLWISDPSHGLFRLTGATVAEHIAWRSLGSNRSAETLSRDPAGGGIWLGFRQGGVAYLQGGQIRSSYSVGDGLGQGRVGGLEVDREHALWIATQGGLSRAKGGHITTLTRRNGLACDAVHWSMEDDDHSLWLYTACGLVRILRGEVEAWVADPKHVVRTTGFDSFDGVRSQAMGNGYSPRVSKSKDGKIWFVSNDGVSMIDPRHLPENKLAPPVHIESIKADDKSYDLKRGMALPPKVRDIRIDYTALSLAAAEKVHFNYKLEGQDRDWKEVINERQAKYTNLAPRQYVFRVIASNNSGVWNETGDTLEFSVAPAWNQTMWFYASCVAAFLAATWGIYRLRLYQIAREFNAQLDGRVDERLRVARDLHDTMLQTFQAALIQMQAGYNLLSRRPEKAAEAIEKAITTSAGAIAEGRDAIQSMRSSTVTKNDLARALRVAGDQMAAEGSAKFDVRVQGPSRDVHPILRDEVYRIALEALRNAFKHAEATAIEAEIVYGDSLRVRIRDDGKGIDPTILQEGRRSGHYGIPGMRERAERVGGKLDVWSGAGAGTEIQLTIPGTIAFGTSGVGSLFSRIWRKAKSETAAHG